MKTGCFWRQLWWCSPKAGWLSLKALWNPFKKYVNRNNTKFCDKIAHDGGPWPFSERHSRICATSTTLNIACKLWADVQIPRLANQVWGVVSRAQEVASQLTSLSSATPEQVKLLPKKAQTISRRGLSLRTSSAPCMQRWSMPWRLARTCLP